jgi:hypothetical protein
MRKRIRSAFLFLIVAMTFSLSACSKKSTGENGGATSSPNGNWDSMVWDQGNWS